MDLSERTPVSSPRARAAVCAGASSQSALARKRLLSTQSLWKSLDRVDVLGDGVASYGHSGCVNALSWLNDDKTLMSAGDDTRVHFWQMTDSGTATDCPAFQCSAIIHTGHRSNIFNVKRLPHSTKIATCARDAEVRIFDAARALAPPRPSSYLGHDVKPKISELATDACLRVFRCHASDVKKIVEESPHNILTVSEDSTVRAMDVRAPHACSRSGCPTPLVEIHGCPLSALTVSALVPYNFVIAGESQYGFLFDRRMVGRAMREEWGNMTTATNITSCVRRFRRVSPVQGGRTGSERITGAKLSQYNGQELLLSYHGDAVYLFSIHDDVSERSKPRARLAPNRKRRHLNEAISPRRQSLASGAGSSSGVHMPREERDDVEGDSNSNPDMTEALPDQEDNPGSDQDLDDALRLPVVHPRARMAGHCNVDTVKDVNFLGPNDTWVVSGSDDGNWFLWDKGGMLEGIWEGDGSVCNVVEAHPSLPLVATSGIDKTVKIFAPKARRGARTCSRIEQKSAIVAANSQHLSRRFSGLQELFFRYHSSLLLGRTASDQHDDNSDDAEEDADVAGLQCAHQ